jgi:hypothetical protein
VSVQELTLHSENNGTNLRFLESDIKLTASLLWRIHLVVIVAGVSYIVFIHKKV